MRTKPPRNPERPGGVNKTLRRRIDEGLAPLVRYTRRVAAIDIDASVDRLFRYLEMLTVTALIGTIGGVIDPQSGRAITMVLSFLAGVYIALPIARWQLRVEGGHRRTFAINRWGPMAIAFGLAIQSMVIADWSVKLISKTISIDARSALETAGAGSVGIWSRACSEAAANQGRDPSVCESSFDKAIRELPPKP